MNVTRGLALLFVMKLKAISGQFLDQPDPGTVFVPVDEQITLTCSVEKRYVTDWQVLWHNGDRAEASSKITSQELINRNFTFEGVATNRSTLSLRETENQTNNETNITCIAKEEGTITTTTDGNTVEVIFYGAPPPPTDLSVIENKLNTVNLSWSLGFIEGVPVNYTLTVLNLNTTSAQPIIIAGLLDQHYVFETSRPCDVYSFTVTAVTVAGNSTPSQELIFFVHNCNQKGSTTNAVVYGATIGAVISALSTMLIVIIFLACYCKQKRRLSRKSIATTTVTQLQAGSESGDARVDTHAHVAAEIAQDALLTEEEERKTVIKTSMAESSEVNSEVDQNKSATKLEATFSGAEVEEEAVYAQVDKSKSGKKQSTISSSQFLETMGAGVSKEVDLSEAEALYAQVDMNKTKKREVMIDNDDGVKALYAQVNKSRRRKPAYCLQAEAEDKNIVMAEDSETGIEAHYAQLVDMNRQGYEAKVRSLHQVNQQKLKMAEGSEVEGALYAQVNKNKQMAKESVAEVKSLYAKVDKCRKKEIAALNEAEIEALYAQVDKSKK